MRPEIEQIIEELKLIYPGDDFAGHRERIEKWIEAAEIKNEYDEAKIFRPYGSAAEIKQELAEKYYTSVETIDYYATRI